MMLFVRRAVLQFTRKPCYRKHDRAMRLGYT